MNYITDLLKSKKFRVAFSGILLVILNDVFQLGIDPESVQMIFGLAGTYIIGQGVADHGKEKAEIERETEQIQRENWEKEFEADNARLDTVPNEFD